MSGLDPLKVLKELYLRKKSVNIYINLNNKYYFMDNVNFEQIEIGGRYYQRISIKIFKRK